MCNLLKEMIRGGGYDFKSNFAKYDLGIEIDCKSGVVRHGYRRQAGCHDGRRDGTVR